MEESLVTGEERLVKVDDRTDIKQHLPNDNNHELLKSHADVVVEGSNNSKRFRLTIEPLLFGLVLADALSGPVVTNLVIKRSCEVHFGYNQSKCSKLDFSHKNQTDLEALVQPYASVILTGMNLLSIFFPVILSLFLGSWSDRNGRKLLLTVPTIGFALKFLLLTIFSLIPGLHPSFLFIAVLPVALTGGFVNFMTATYSYICDISEKSKVSFRIGVAECFMLIGSIVGALWSSHLFDMGGSYGYSITFGVSTTIMGIAAAYNHFFIQESLQVTDGDGSFRNVFDMQLLKDMFRVAFKKQRPYKRAVIISSIVLLTFSISALEGEANLRFLYSRRKFNWDIEQYTKWISLSHGTIFLGFIIGSFLLIKWLMLSDVVLGIIASLSFVSGDLFAALVPSEYSYLMYYEGIVKLFSGFLCPAGRALISKSVPEEDLGKVFALTTSCESIFPLVTIPLYALLYNSTIDTVPGAFFLLSSGFFVTDTIIFIAIYVILKVSKTSDYDILDNKNEGS